MRDRWGRGKEKRLKSTKVFPPEIKKYYLEHLARKRAFLETRDKIIKIFVDYTDRLGDAGFSKI